MAPKERVSKGNDLAFWEAAIADAHLLWHWELTRLTGAGKSLSDQQLIARWMRQQSFVQRARGWLFVLRREGWHRSWRKWVGWAPRALRASPRYWVYAAASELFFRLPARVTADSHTKAQENCMRQLHFQLPVLRNPSLTATPDWRRSASEIVWNYHRFLEGTRS